jgi:hypothetical protein
METRIPAAWTLLLGAKGSVWNEYTVPQKGMVGKVKYCPQGETVRKQFMRGTNAKQVEC